MLGEGESHPQFCQRIVTVTFIKRLAISFYFKAPPPPQGKNILDQHMKSILLVYYCCYMVYNKMTYFSAVYCVVHYVGPSFVCRLLKQNKTV